MAKFLIQKTQRSLPGTLPPAQLRLDTSFTQGADTGTAVAGAALAVVGGISKKLQLREKIKIKNRKNLDSANADIFKISMDKSNDEWDRIKGKTQPQDLEDERKKQLAPLQGELDGLDLSDAERQKQQVILDGFLSDQTSTAFVEGSDRLKTIAIDSQNQTLTDLFRSGDAESVSAGVKNYTELLRNNGKTAKEITAGIRAAQEAGEKLKGDDAANNVYAAIEGKQLGLAKQLATDSAIPESRQATLRTAIETAENKIIAEQRRAQQDLINTTTSDTIRESYQGTLTIAELDNRHEKGLIKDAAFESMRKALASGIPDVSDPFIRSEMSNAVTQFKAGQIDKEAVQLVYLNSLPSLDKTDRDKFDNDMAATTIKIVETGMANAKRAGDELISPQFRSETGATILPDFTGENAKKEREEAERKLNLEMRLQNQYYDALDEWKESQVGKDITSRDIRRIENSLLIEFRKIKNVELDRLERGISAVETKQATPRPLKKSKSLRQQNVEQLKARREQLRKQLIK